MNFIKEQILRSAIDKSDPTPSSPGITPGTINISFRFAGDPENIFQRFIGIEKNTGRWLYETRDRNITPSSHNVIKNGSISPGDFSLLTDIFLQKSGVFTSNVNFFVINQIFPLVKIYEYYSKFIQWLYNQFPKSRKDFQKILKIICEKNLSEFSIIDIMEHLYGERIHNDPKYKELEERVEELLNVMVINNDIAKEKNSHKFRPKNAHLTHFKLSEDERRHRENRRRNTILIWLTGILAIVGVIQTGLIKCPTLIDFSTPSKIEVIVIDETKPDYSLSIKNRK